ncbi:hypothetical protein TSUD_72180 [Trifolium subterraneum]|uniref:uDENN domain-containing protein n=1 Tax=Trifolium subterraneum TaxID=3900 RepID=A0A2Z6NRB7_TRISU|nr:hypothetical protein TSUD_72180 [Trifolium subterraneum]
MSQIFEYFVVCGIGAEIRSIDGTKGYHGPGWMYLPSLLDQYPPSTHTLYPPAPPQLPTCVLPAGAVFYSSGFDPNDPSTFPRSYPIVLTVSPPMAFNKTFPTRNATQIACVPLHSHQHSDSVVPPMSSSESSTFSQVMARMLAVKFFILLRQQQIQPVLKARPTAIELALMDSYKFILMRIIGRVH